jgi:hypothetical protein
MCWLRTYYVPGTVLGTRYRVMVEETRFLSSSPRAPVYSG